MPNGVTVAGRTVFDHCLIVGKVAQALIERFPAALRDKLFPEGSPLACATHDNGKVSPFFCTKIQASCSEDIAGIPLYSGIDPALESAWGGHAGVGQICAQHLGAPKYVPEIIGQHHGYSPPVSQYTWNSAVFGGQAWHEERKALITALKTELNMDWPKIESVAQAKVIAGLTTVSDCIGSGQFFEDPSVVWDDNTITQAVNDAGMVPITVKGGLSFSDVFGFTTKEPQAALIDAVTGPGVYVLEGQMGMGKTEAALYAAYTALASGKANGIYFALPTQLTSNKIYDRFNRFLDKVLTPDCHHRSLLLHGSAHLLEQLEMGEDARPGGAWFNQAKRGLLAPFAVGTLDQALMAVMNVKHGFVRTYGLAGKVVILDEVHTYDAYTGCIMDALIKTLRELQCTVIILSATLNQEKRSAMLGTPLHNMGYPLITACPNEKPAQEIELRAENTHTVKIVHCRTADAALDEALSRAAQGQQVLWIVNTVKEAQARYRDICLHADAMGIEVGLIHSKFTQQHRSEHEEHWVNLYGKPGWQSRSDRGRILIGTQVLEQSIDIDADILITAFCPSDMLLQRLGRLWRHADTPRHPNATCEAWIISPNLHEAIDDPQKTFGSSAFVYSPYVLCRALEVWSLLDTVKLPGDIRDLIERSYALRIETGPMKLWLDQLDNGTRHNIGRQALGQLARLSLSSETTQPDDEAKTRYSSETSIDVLLLKGFEQRPKIGHLDVTGWQYPCIASSQ